jgi:hypothetical protein
MRNQYKRDTTRYKHQTQTELSDNDPPCEADLKR